MTGHEEIIERLDRIQATLALAFSEQIRAAGNEVRADRVNAAILDAAQDWIGTTALREKVGKQLSMTPRSVRDRFPRLLAQGLLELRGSEKRPEFRSTGLV